MDSVQDLVAQLNARRVAGASADAPPSAVYRWAAAVLATGTADEAGAARARLAALRGRVPPTVLDSEDAEVLDELVALGLVVGELPAGEARRMEAALEDLQARVEGLPRHAAWLAPRARAWSRLLQPGRKHPLRELLAALVAAPAAADEADARAAHRDATVRRVEREVRLRTWRAWRTRQAAPVRTALEPLLEERLAAAGAREEYERVALGEVFDGELTLARAPDRLLLEWYGDGAPPQRAFVGEVALTVADTAVRQTPAAWELGAAPDGKLTVRVERDGEVQGLSWP